MRRREVHRRGDVNAGHTSVLPIATDLIFISIAAYLLINYARVILSNGGASLLIAREGFLIVYLMMALILLTIRSRARTYTMKRLDYAYTVLGFSIPLAFQPTLQAGSTLHGSVLELLGLVLVVSAFLSLNRSFGLAPENRGVRTGGAYRLVRHPMYLGYILAEAGYILDNISGLNFLVFAVSVLFLLLRLRAEETLLKQDRSYKDFSKRVRWRLLPFVF